MRSFIFDVDGTLTPSRGRMHPEFKKWFEPFATHNAVYFVTGSDREKTLEQLGVDIYSLAVRVYQCNGNDVWEQSRNISTNHLQLPAHMEKHMNRILEESQYHTKTGKHIEHRPGLVNFSIVGRNATRDQRKHYVQWDNDHKERELLAKLLRTNYPGLDVTVAGETGIDITKRRSGKEQVVSDLDMDYDIYFFGDKVFPGGNDYSIAVELINKGKTVHRVENWKDTWKILNGLK